MNTDTKVIIGVIVATVVFIGGGAWYASQKPAATTEGQTLSAEQAARLVHEDDPALGATDAKVTVVEFGDFQCPACGALHSPLKQVKEQYQDQPVRFVFRQFPLTQIHEHALLAAEASLAAGAQGKFWEMHDLLFEGQTQLEREDLEKYAQQLELNMDQFRQALDEHSFQDAVAQDVADGRALNIRGTPTLYINGVQYTGQYSASALGAAIEVELTE